MRFVFPVSVALTGLAVAAAALPAQTTQSRAPAAHVYVTDSTGVGDTSMFAPLNLPAGNEFRSGAGVPGPKYWEQRVDYELHGTLDTTAKSVRGQETIHYTNNSPDTLKFIWVQVEQNAFKSGSLNSYVFPANSRFGARNFEGGDVIEHFDQVTAAKHTPLKTRVEGTVMKVDLASPLAPGHQAVFDVAWHFLVPEHGADRMGRDGALYEIAQWYPRLCVYDDQRGWNTEPYLGQGEFYLEYGDFDLYVTVPAGYIVAATGSLANPTEVLTAAERSRLATAAKSSKTVAIVTQADLESGAARPRKTGTMTWHFKAQDVRDAVWAASPDYLWDAQGWNGHMAYGYYRPSAIEDWKESADMARMSIQEYSERWFPYPWPQISAVEGPISGMEYPMLAMEAPSTDKYGLYNVITHEIGHQWYPMIVGSNERMHMWQDEGFNTFINYFSEARRYPEKGTELQRALSDMRGVEQYMQYGLDQPLEVNPDRINPRLLGENAYVKTAVGLHLLRNEIMGPAAFDDAFRAYTHRWAFRHPTPTDFFHTMEDVGGRRLDWFFREWFLDNPHFDQAIDTVATRSADSVIVRYANRARGVLPIIARFTFSDGTTQYFDYPAEVWSTNTSFYDRVYQFPGKKVTKIELDPEKHLVDTNRNNNTWVAP
jgi:hypothetical protein